MNHPCLNVLCVNYLKHACASVTHCCVCVCVCVYVCVCMHAQLRKWQQHMQEQLKASQLEELLLQQEEQQRQLEKMNGSKDSTKGKQTNSKYNFNNSSSDAKYLNLFKTCRTQMFF